MVREAGFELRIELHELATAAQMMNAGDVQAFLIGWSGRVDPAERARHHHAALGIALPARHRIGLTHAAWRFAHAARLSGFRAIPDGIMRLEGVPLD